MNRLSWIFVYLFLGWNGDAIVFFYEIKLFILLALFENFGSRVFEGFR